MAFLPLTRMWERVERSRADSDTALFHDLMHLGEMVSKVTVLGLVAAISDDPDRSRYRQLYALVRATGVGEWADVLDNILTGPPAQYLCADARTEARELTEKCGPGTWQYDSVSLLHGCLKLIDSKSTENLVKLEGRRWFRMFARLRNKTRGHGATKSSVLSQICVPLERSLRLVADNYSLFKRQWAYLHRNLSGKYRATDLSGPTTSFDYLKKTTTVALPNGVYVFLESPAHVELMESNVDAEDFYLANGEFNGKRFEMLSYITGETLTRDADPYSKPPGPLPVSETQGLGSLEIQGQCFLNLPPARPEYITREVLEGQLISSLRDDRHPIVTLHGRGGIGKTSLALAALHHLKEENRFYVILWFSARDIDLLAGGAKAVKPHVVSEKDIAAEFVRLTEPSEAKGSPVKPLDYLAGALAKSPFGGPILFVFDNFETVTSPADVFKWMDIHVRSPNKVLITARHREFTGDYAIEVRGMSESECERLIASTAARLGIQGLLTTKYNEELIRESEGHPYVIKVLLGEVAKAGRVGAIDRIFASKEEILTALFERTYTNLSPAAQRVFLTLSNWRATLPLVAIEAVLLRPQNERMDVGEAVTELDRSSFVELTQSETDGQTFVNVPLITALFGKRKLAVSPLKGPVEADTELLREFGAGKQTDVKRGLAPRVQRLIKSVASKISGGDSLDKYVPVLEFVAREHPQAWLSIAELWEESQAAGAIQRAKDAVRSFLEHVSPGERMEAWKKLETLCHRSLDVTGEVHALVEMCEDPKVPFWEISAAANRFNTACHSPNAPNRDTRIDLARRLANLMELHADEMNATDCSRLAWLCLQVQDEDRARRHVKHGLALEMENEYCASLAERLGILPPSLR